MGPAKQPTRLAHLAGKALPTDVRMAPSPAHVRDELPPPRRGHRAVVDGARAHANHHHPTLSPSAHRGLEREPSEGLNPESLALTVLSSCPPLKGCGMTDRLRIGWCHDRS